jgi:hypothetical protein
MNAFEPDYGYWHFARTVLDERRWVFDGKSGNFLAAVRAASKSRGYPVKAGHRLWRAQDGCRFEPDEKGGEWQHPLLEDRMVPNPQYIKKGGRANPPGFAYLYLADSPKTALAEMGRWVGQSLTLATFELRQDVNLVVCRAGPEHATDRFFEEKPSPVKLSKYVWNDISEAFSRPVSREDREIAYVPTQILAEAFKADGFDGLVYRSGLERGSNVVLFNKDIAKLIHRYVYTVKKVCYDFEAAPYHEIHLKKPDGLEAMTEIHTESPSADE